MPGHTASDFEDEFQAWFPADHHQPDDSYHLIVAPRPGKSGSDPPFETLKAYFESAHADAREYFHAVCQLDLHPNAKKPGSPPVEYPNRLHESVRKGLFGEVLCGVVAETWYLLKGNRDFKVPVFMFRFHSGVEEALNKLLDGGEPGDFAGRHGDDFLAIELDEDDEVTGILVAEAKFRTRMGPSEFKQVMVTKKKVLPKLAAEPDVPLSITRLTRLLKDVDADAFERVRASLEQVHFRQRVVDRIDMAVLVYEGHGPRSSPPYANTASKPPDHDVERPLVTVEMLIPGATDLMNRLYTSLYT